MAEGGGGRVDFLRRERAFVAVVAFLVSTVLAHFVHTAWDLPRTMKKMFAAQAAVMAVAPASRAVPVAYAPDAYRVAVPALIRWVISVTHPVDIFLVNTAIDFCCAFAALLFLYAVAVRGFPADAGQRRTERWAVVLLLLAAVQFPLAWVAQWQRPETMPTALYLAFALYCCLRTADSAEWLIPLFVATLWQGFVRADAAVFFGAGLLIVGFLGGRAGQFRSRAATLLSGAGVVLLAGGVQAYLQFVLFPHLTYPPDTPVLQWRGNLSFHNLQSAGIAVLPFVLLAIVVAVKRIRLGATEWVVFVSAGLYLLLWFAVGVLDEVRIFVPYMLLLCVVAARTLVPWLMESTHSVAGPTEARHSD
ncbi:MAG: hypothetical protein NVSMB62_26020 [Acidobacteriaceae bacterium]